jgi:glycosyltransferase involved in cell wall biosynthesis
MRIMIVQATSRRLAQSESYRNALGEALQAEGHKTQWLDLPSIDVEGRAITNIASLRLLGTADNADLLLCLDSVAALLRHPRKIVVALDDSCLEASTSQALDAEASERAYVAKAVRAAINEAEAVFALSSFGTKRLTQAGIKRVTTLAPRLVAATSRYPRRPGSELLVLAALTDAARPELLIDCLAALPEPFRARWVAGDADRATIARMRGRAQQAGVEERLAIDVRPIDHAERSYLIAQCAALIDPGANALLIGDSLVEAVATGVPVVICNDAGAAGELTDSSRVRSAPPVGTSLAQAVMAACATQPSPPPKPAPVEAAAGGEWQLLMKALRK